MARADIPVGSPECMRLSSLTARPPPPARCLQFTTATLESRIEDTLELPGTTQPRQAATRTCRYRVTNGAAGRGLAELVDAGGRRVGLGYLEMTGYAARLRLG